MSIWLNLREIIGEQLYDEGDNDAGSWFGLQNVITA